MTTSKLQVIHYGQPGPYAPCGAAYKTRTRMTTVISYAGRMRSSERKRITYANHSTLAREVSCDNCKRTAPYWRAAISQIYGAKPVRAVREEFYCPDPERCAHKRIGMQYRLLCERSRVHDVSPAGGDSWPYGEWEEDSDSPTHIIVPYTGYSDYSGGGVERSNNRALREDYPATFTEATGGYGTSELLLSLDWRHPNGDDFTEGLVEALNGLADYALYDEQDHSMLEMEVADEAWDQFLSMDVPRQLQDKAISSDAMEDAIEALDELAARHAWDTSKPEFRCECGWLPPLVLTGDHMEQALYRHVGKYPSLRDMFYESLRDQDESPYLESATSIVFPCMDESVNWIDDRIWAMRCADNPQVPAWFNPDQARLPGMPAKREEI
jgi:hypothetical protein